MFRSEQLSNAVLLLLKYPLSLAAWPEARKRSSQKACVAAATETNANVDVESKREGEFARLSFRGRSESVDSQENGTMQLVVESVVYCCQRRLKKGVWRRRRRSLVPFLRLQFLGMPRFREQPNRGGAMAR